MKLIILDRDGVINIGSNQFIKTPDEWKPIPGSLEAIARLTREGWRVWWQPISRDWRVGCSRWRR